MCVKGCNAPVIATSVISNEIKTKLSLRNPRPSNEQKKKLLTAVFEESKHKLNSTTF